MWTASRYLRRPAHDIPNRSREVRVEVFSDASFRVIAKSSAGWPVGAASAPHFGEPSADREPRLVAMARRSRVS